MYVLLVSSGHYYSNSQSTQARLAPSAPRSILHHAIHYRVRFLPCCLPPLTIYRLRITSPYVTYLTNSITNPGYGFRIDSPLIHPPPSPYVSSISSEHSWMFFARHSIFSCWLVVHFSLSLLTWDQKIRLSSDLLTRNTFRELMVSLE